MKKLVVALIVSLISLVTLPAREAEDQPSSKDIVLLSFSYICRQPVYPVSMGPFSEQDLKYASDFREWVHEEVLKKVHERYPEIEEVVDPHPVEEYFQQVWDYPGAWYTVVAIPERYRNRKALVDTLVKLTIEKHTG